MHLGFSCKSAHLGIILTLNLTKKAVAKSDGYIMSAALFIGRENERLATAVAILKHLNPLEIDT